MRGMGNEMCRVSTFMDTSIKNIVRHEFSHRMQTNFLDAQCNKLQRVTQRETWNNLATTFFLYFIRAAPIQEPQVIQTKLKIDFSRIFQVN